MAVSPAVHPTRPSGMLDFKKHAEYPIILGDSLKDAQSTGDRFMDLRFNWQPKAGFQDYKSRLSNTERGVRVHVTNKTTHDSAFEYIGHERPAGSDEHETSSFALVFDKQRSAFVLESLSASIDLNLESASTLSKDDVRRRQKLPTGPPTTATSSVANKPTPQDEQPDPDNPFDYRNFLEEAREQIDKPAGSKSPLPGSRTPLSGFASPAIAPTRFVSTVTSTASAAPKKPRAEKPATKPLAKKPPATNHRPARQPLSSEKVSDSDDEMSDAPAPPAAAHKPSATSKPPSTTKSHGHTRQVSANIGQSPHIVVNDGDLEIDMGSPPPEARRRKRAIDTDAFRSHTGTPVVGLSPHQKPQHEHRDHEMRDAHRDNDEDEDDDVEELDLGSPHNEPSTSKSGSARRDTRREEPAPTPPPPQVVEEDDEIAELEDLLGGDDDADMSGGLGLGISGTSGRVDDDDESDVSEEE
jgi:hypothetical protein